MLDTGRHPRMGFEPRQRALEIEAVNDFRNRMKTGLEEAKAALGKAKAEYSHYYDCQRTPALTLKPGDREWLNADDIKTTTPPPVAPPPSISDSETHSSPSGPHSRTQSPPPPPPTLVHGVKEFDVDS